MNFSQRKKDIIYRIFGNKVGAFCGIGDPDYREINKERAKKILMSIIIKEKKINLDIMGHTFTDGIIFFVNLMIRFFQIHVIQEH